MLILVISHGIKIVCGVVCVYVWMYADACVSSFSYYVLNIIYWNKYFSENEIHHFWLISLNLLFLEISHLYL